MWTKALIFCLGFLIAFACLNRGWLTPEIYICSFDHINGTFTVSGRELLRRDAVMITVHRGTRTFMFRRIDLYTCEKDATDQT